MHKSQNILHYKHIGEVRYVRSTRAKNLAIRINQQGEIRVTVPRYASQRQAERFFLSKNQWVRKRLEELKTKGCRQHWPEEGSHLQVRGRSYPVLLSGAGDTLESAIWRILQTEARQYLPERVKRLSEHHGFEIHGLKIRKMRSRWGSCTARKSINLNSWLVMLPEYLSDYVILHELVHTRVHHHGKEFWAELDRLTGGQARRYQKELRGHQIMCFPGDPSDQ